MKLKLSIVTYFLLFIFIILPLAVGCGGEQGIDLDKPTSDTGNHTLTSKVTGKNISSGGVSDYKIVISDNAGEHTVFAAGELRELLNESSGISLPIIRDNDLVNGGKYLSIGENSLSKSAGIKFDYDRLGYNGLIIETKDDSVFMGGAGEFGNMNSVYRFLEHTVGFEQFTAEAYSLDYVRDIPLLEFHGFDVPDIQWRVGGYYSVMNYSQKYTKSGRRLMYNTPADAWLAPGNLAHNSFLWLPKADYQDSHDKWYSDDGTQLCMTAHGDEVELQALVDTVVAKMVNMIKSYPYASALTFTQEDFDTWCTCKSCSAERDKYGTNAAVYVKLANRLSDTLNAWIATNDEGVPHDRKVDITMFAYLKSTDAPVKQNEDGSYSPIDDSVIPRKNVSIWIAPIYAEYTIPFTHQRNQYYAGIFDKWCSISDNISLWSYNTIFNNYLFPYNTFDATAENYRYIYEKGISNIFDQGQYDSERSTAMTELKIYLNSKLGWNINANMGELIDRYFENVFGPAKEEMLGYFTQLRVWTNYLRDYDGLLGGIWADIGKSQRWPKPVLDGFKGKIEAAYEAIEELRLIDPATYERIDDAINRESIFVDYALLTFYSGEYSDYTLTEMNEQFEKNLARSGVTAMGENQPI